MISMAKKKRRKLNKNIFIILGLSLILIGGIVLLNTNFNYVGVRSVHSDAKKYQTRHCLAFYPDSSQGKAMAKQICKDHKDEDEIYDYALIPYGDYYLVSYSEEYQFYADQEYQPVSIETISEKGTHIVADYLRYTIKKERPEQYYDAEFIRSTAYENLNFDNVTYAIDGDSVACTMPDYDLVVDVPLKYLQEEIGMNFGYASETYTKPTYIDDEHPVICFGFDDGPQFWYPSGETSTERIVDLLYEYDASATFFIVGDCLEERDAWSDYQVTSFFTASIAQGNEYGSHTQGHVVLTDLDTADEIREEIEGPAETMYKLFGYQMKLYRPPEGSFNDNVLANTDLCAILWDLDATDWSLRDGQEIYDKVIDWADRGIIETGDVVCVHDIYDETADAMEMLIPELINRGYQIVTVSDMLEYLNIDSSTVKYFYSPTYYE